MSAQQQQVQIPLEFRAAPSRLYSILLPCPTSRTVNASYNFGYVNKNINRSFICKSYIILMCQLLITLILVSLVTLHNTINVYVKSNHYYINKTVFLILVIILPGSMFYKNLRRKTLHSCIFLFLYTLTHSFLLAQSVSNNYPEYVFLALGIITSIFVFFTIFAFHCKLHFVLLSGFFVVVITVLFIISILAVLFTDQLLMIFIIVKDLLFCVSNNILLLSYLLHPGDSWL